MADQRKGKRYAHYNPAYEAYIRRLLERQQGVSAPEDLEEDAKAKYYAPPLTKYVDPRDKYAGSPVASGIANVLGGILQPGRASNIEEMNRQHFESLPQQQAQQSSLLTDSQLEALKQKALGGDENAQRLLTTYVQALSPRAGGGTVPPWTTLAGGEVAGRDTEGVAKPKPPPGGDDDLSDPLTRVVDDSMTPAEATQATSSRISDIDEEIQQIEADKARGKHTEVHAQQAGGSGFPSSYSSTTDVENTIGWNKQADARHEELNAEKAALEGSEYSPAGSGEPGRAGEATIR